MRKLADTVDLRTAFDASPNAYALLAPDLMIAGVNQAYVAAAGKSRETLVGRFFLDAFGANPAHRDSLNQIAQSMLKAADTGEQDHLAVVRFTFPAPDDAPDLRSDDRYWSSTHTPIHDDDGRILYILQHVTEITGIERLRRRAGGGGDSDTLDVAVGGRVFDQAERIQADNRQLERERRRLMELFVHAPGFIALVSVPDMLIDMANPATVRLLGGRDLVGRTVRDAVPELEEQGLIDQLEHVMTTGEPFVGREALVRLRNHRGEEPRPHYLNFIFQPVRDDGGRAMGVLIQGHEVTDTVLAQQRQRLMIDELNHRVKNTLATVQSIAMQTARTHQDPASFAESFQARLVALSHTHNLLTRSHWEGADLRSVLEHETLAHGPNRVLVNGPSVPLSPATAVSLGMVFHELATNAAKYGALSVGEGRVFVEWSLGDLRAPVLRIIWSEQGGPPVAQPPERRGFGSRLIERNIRHDLTGDVQFAWADEGLMVEISVPLDRSEDT